MPAPAPAPAPAATLAATLAETPAQTREHLVKVAARARERLALVGLVLVAAGAGLIYVPAAFIVPGVYLLVVSWPRQGRVGGGDHGAR